MSIIVKAETSVFTLIYNYRLKYTNIGISVNISYRVRNVYASLSL